MPNRQTIEEIRWLVAASRAQRIRPILEFAEQEIVIPEGLHEGTRYRADTLPWQRLWFEAIDSGKWSRFILTACVQGGKTLVGWVIPILWHLFEWKENFGAGVTSIDLAGDKWKLELLPAIDASPKFRALKPLTGRGSRGGSFEMIEFQHGPVLKFLSGGGGDEKRSSITLRGSAITEADRLDTAGEASREAAPIYQIEGRSASFEDRARLYAECTTTITTGFVNRERETGSGSRIMCPCPHCREYVSPEREHLVGWSDATSEHEARENAAWCCPNCGVIITEPERATMNHAAVLVHRGQTITRDGVIEGKPPANRTLSFRANAWNNLLWSGAYIAAQEWLAMHDRDQDSAEKKMRQWYWALPVEPNAIDVTPLAVEDVIGRQAEQLTRRIVPRETLHVSGAADVRKTQIHYVIVAWYRADNQVRAHVVDVGIVPVESKRVGIRKALHEGLRTLRDQVIERGYREQGSDRVWRPGWFPIDAYWNGQAVRDFVRECNAMGLRRYIPSFGRGLSAEHGRGRYQHPLEETAKRPHVGEEYYIAWSAKYGMHHLVVNADHWKTFVREGFATPPDQLGAIGVFDATTEDELRLVQQFAKQIVAERAYTKVVPEKGEVLCYSNDSGRPNHFGDAMYNACASGHLCGVRVVEARLTPAIEAPMPIAAAAAPEPLTMPDGRPFFITQRD